MVAGPLAKVQLPDGQTILAVVLGRTRQRDGTWWYDLEVTLLAKVDRPQAPSRAEPFPVRFRAPFPLVQPIEGQLYDGYAAFTRSSCNGRTCCVDRERSLPLAFDGRPDTVGGTITVDEGVRSSPAQ
jgi:hypothetical protein